MNGVKKFFYCSFAVAFLASNVSAQAGNLNLLVWEGYADKSYVNDFEKASGCTVTATYIGSNDDFLPKLMAGGSSVYDLMSASTDVVPVLIAADVVDPVDTKRVANYAEVYKIMRENPSLSSDGNTYAIPFQWGANPFIYRTDKITTPPTSIGDVWKAEYKGKVGMWDDKSSLYNTARLLGIKEPFKMTDAELEKVKAKLIEQKPLVRKYWSTAGELTNLIASGEIYISYTWGGLILNELKKLNIPVAEFTPKEGQDGWIDNWMLVKGSPNKDCAYKYMEYMNTAKGQCGVSAVTGYFPVNPAARSCMSAEVAQAMHVGDTNFLFTLHIWQTPERIVEYSNAWNSVKAAP